MASILVVDDSAVVRRMLALILERSGHEVRCAGDGAGGLEAVAQRRPDLVLCDLEMPVADGVAFVRRLREGDTVRSVPVVMLTGAPASERPVVLADLGVQGFVTKPVRSAEVLELVGAVLSAAGRPS